jgi:hypothetical protein
MNPNERLQLQNMLGSNNDFEDQTSKIRDLKHSTQIRNDVKAIQSIQNKCDQADYGVLCMSTAPFLFNNYTDIFNKVKKQELNLDILAKFLDVLEQIEEGKCDQHEGSFQVGKILKELYVDSALRKAEKLNNTDDNDNQLQEPSEDISWREFKKKML